MTTLTQEKPKTCTLTPFAINITGGDWWERIEKLVWMFIEAKKHA
ncbi:MAG: hypothetical protein ACKPJO_12285 [Dolichospermum sp.]